MPTEKERRLEDVRVVATDLILAMLDVISGKPAPEGHSQEDQGRKRELGTWCERPWENHSEVDSELATLIDEHVELLVKKLTSWEQEV